MSCRILYVIGELHTGGAERQLYYLLRAMDRELFKPAVAVWNYREGDQYVDKIRELGITIYKTKADSSSRAKLAWFRKLVQRLQPAVVHSYSFYTNFAAQCAAIGSGILPVGSLRSDFAWAVDQCGPIVGRLSARWPAALICNSFSGMQSAQSNGGAFAPRKLFVVRNGIDFAEFPNFPMPSNNSQKILGIGYLLPVKRWDLLLNAAKHLNDRGLSFVVQIAGDGPLQSILEKQAEDLGIRDRVHFIGHVDDVARLLAEAAVVVHTSDSEGCPNAVMEAMACSRPVVATQAGDIPSLVDHGKTGFVVPRESNGALADSIANLLANPDLCHRFGQAARKKAESEFGLQRMVNETFGVYRQCRPGSSLTF